MACHDPLTGKQRATWLLYSPFPPWGGEDKGKKKAKLLGQDKDILTEQQMKRTVPTIILIIRIHKAKSTTHRATLTYQCQTLSRAMIHYPLASSPKPEPSMTVHGIE